MKLFWTFGRMVSLLYMIYNKSYSLYNQLNGNFYRDKRPHCVFQLKLNVYNWKQANNTIQ